MAITQLFTALVQLLLLWLSISAHEAAHGWVAERCGDPTARLLGKVTLNPLRHLDLAGSVLLPAALLAFGLPVFFGWGRPAYWVTRNLRRPYWDSLVVRAAGPAANLLLALAAMAAVAVAIPALGEEARKAAALSIPFFGDEGAGARLAGFPLMFTLVRLAALNAFLAVFNLLPLPPLDGGQIALQLLPADWAAKLAAMRPFGFVIGLALFSFGVVAVLVLLFIAILGLVVTGLA
jgi:Zn-dependent protease